MNEIGLLRDQLAAERTRVREVAGACAAAHASAPLPTAETSLEACSEICAAYLRQVLGGFERRDRRLVDLYSRLPADDSVGRVLAELRSDGSAGEGLARLAALGAAGGSGGAAGPLRQAWAELAHFIDGPWSARRVAIEALLASNPRVADWRAFAGVDADSIVAERALYVRVGAALPAGIQLVAGQVQGQAHRG